MCSLTSIRKQFVVGVVLCLVFVAALADGIEGTWRLLKRELPDGTIQTPPTVAGLYTLNNGLRHLNAYSSQIDHRFHGDCDQSFHSKAISGSTSNRSALRCSAAWEVGRYSAVSACVKFSFFRMVFPLKASL